MNAPAAGLVARELRAFDEAEARERADLRQGPPTRWKDPAEPVTPVIVRSFFGERLAMVVPDPVALGIERYGHFEAGLTRMLLCCLRPGQCFYDVGAHMGYFTLLASRLVGPGGGVHAFEPTPSTFRGLAANAGGRAGVRLNQAAVWSGSDRLRILDLGPRFSAFNSLLPPRLPAELEALARPVQVEVPALSLDDYARDTGTAPDFVKIDAESAEAQVLRGMAGLLEQARPLVAIETGDLDVPGAALCRELVAFLETWGYRGWEYHAGELHEHSRQDRYRYDNLLFAPRERTGFWHTPEARTEAA